MIEIRHRFTDEIIVSGDYCSIKEACEKNKADLRGAYLWQANLHEADLRGANLHKADLQQADLHEANLWQADLRGANLRGTDLHETDLWEADLRGIKNYSAHHEIFQEVIRQQKVETFTDKEWGCIGQICIHRLCWDTIKKRFNKTALSVFKKLSKVGFNEWEKEYNKINSPVAIFIGHNKRFQSAMYMSHRGTDRRG